MQYQHLVHDFAKRTRDNLRVLRSYQNAGGEAHEVTQLVNSMLGLLVLPKEHYYQSIPTTPLKELRREGWPEPILEGEFKKPKHLRDLIRLLRNSIAHFNIEFTSADGNRIDGVILANKCNCGKVTWRATLTLNELQEVTERFIELILGEKREPGTERTVTGDE